MENVMKKSISMLGALVVLAWGGSAGAADFITAPLLVHPGELITCQATNVGSKTTDLKVDLIAVGFGSIFGPATCPTGSGGACLQAYVPGAPNDQLVYCRVSPGKKKDVRAVLQVNGGASAVAQ
jgi:hypothetical protein